MKYDLKTLQGLSDELPTVVATLHQDIQLINAVTGRRATIHRGKRTFVVARRGDTRWLFWKSGLSQGRIVGTSDASFVVNLVETKIVDLDTLPPLAKVA